MKYNIKITEAKNEKSKAKAYAMVVFDRKIAVRNISIVERKDGTGVFVSMPSQQIAGKTDEQGNPMYKDTCHPITAEFQQEFSAAILRAYEMFKERVLPLDGFTVGDSKEPMKYSASVTLKENPSGNVIASANVYLEDSFVISGVNLIKNNRGGVFPSMPAYRTGGKDGKDYEYHDIAYPITKEFREELFGTLINEYKEKKDVKEKEVRETVEKQQSNYNERENAPFR